MSAHYYIMKNRKILRLESDMSFNSLPRNFKEKVLDPDHIHPLNQTQANWRVAIFRDEILDFEEFTEWMRSPESLLNEDDHNELIAN